MFLPIFLFLFNLDVKQVNLSKAAEYHSRKADYFYHKGNFPEMLYHLSEKSKYDPEDLTTWSDLAYYYWSMSVDDKVRRAEFQEKAWKNLKTGLSVNNKSAYMWDEIGRFYIYCHKDFKEATKYLSEAVKRNDCEAVSFHFLAQCYFKDGKIEQAIETIENCIKKFPKDEKAKVDLKKYKNLLMGS